MSLLLENAISQFDPESTTSAFYSPEPRDLDSDLDEIPVEVIAGFAENYEKLRDPDKSLWTCIPLHRRNSAELTGEYVCYRDDETYQNIVLYGDREDVEYMDASEFEKTRLARRMRFWHSDYIPPEYPDYYDSPLDVKEKPRHPVDENEFFDGLLGFVEDEKRETIEQNWGEIRGMSPREVYEDGEIRVGAIPELYNKAKKSNRRTSRTWNRNGNENGTEFEFRVDLEPEEEPTKEFGYIEEKYEVYPKNLVVLYPPNSEHAPDTFPIKAEVRETRGLNLVLGFDADDMTTGTERYLGKKRRGFGLVVLANLVPFEREKQAVDEVRKNDKLRDILTGNTEVTFGDSSKAETEELDDDLNQEQKLAVEHALLADDFFVLHGPPGTGKTRTLVEIIRRSVQAGKKVLVCADSNQAVDNIVTGESTDEDVDEGSLHAYAQHSTDDFVLERKNARRSSSPMVRENYSGVADPDVVATTNSSAAKLPSVFDL
ncbi:MAG: AAA domain-containing protein, partial [Halobacteria archaeon]|nr:AAA domain-containing protein [Halobacteria archaeon]